MVGEQLFWFPVLPIILPYPAPRYETLLIIVA